MLTNLKFVALLAILALLFSPLFIMFFTAFIPEGDPFHMVLEKKVSDFQIPEFLLRMKMKTLGNLKWKLERDDGNSYLVLRLDPEHEQGIDLVTGTKDMNVVKALRLKLKNSENLEMRIGLRDANGKESFGRWKVVEGGDWRLVSVDLDLSEFEGIDLERVTRLFVVFKSKVSQKVFVDDVYFINKFPTIHTFYRVLKYDNFGRYILNSAIISFAVVLGNLIFSSMVGYAFARKKFFMKEFLFAFILGMMMIPPQTTIIPVFILMKKIGWIDTYWALIVPALVTPFGIFLMRQYIEQIPVELDQAAKVDGASDWQIFWKIIMPLSKAPLAVLGINVFIGVWNDLFYPLILTTSKEMRTVQLGLAMYQKLNTDWPSLMAASVIAGLPVIIVYLIFQKRIISGVLQGALKG